MNRAEAFCGLAPVPDLALVYRLLEPEVRTLWVEALPPQSKQFAGAQGFRYVQFDQDAFHCGQFIKDHAKLLPGEGGFVGLLELPRDFHAQCRIP